jgi:VWFA-related protein
MRTWSCFALGLVYSCAVAAGAAQSPQAPATAKAQRQESASAAKPGATGETQQQAWPPTPGQPAADGTAMTSAAPPAPANDDRVHLDVVVTDKAGTAMGGLSEQDFTLLDNGKPRKLDSFEALGSTDAHGHPEQVILAIDTVNISFDRVAMSRQYIAQFLRRNGGRLAHPVTIVWVTDLGLQQQLGPSMDGNALAKQLEGTAGQLRLLNRAAGEWGAIERFQMSARMLNQMVDAIGQFPGRKLLIWIGPGWPILDNPNLEITWKQQQQLFRDMVTLTTKIRRAQIQLYSVAEGMPNFYTYLFEEFLKGVKKPSQMNLSNLSLKVMAVWSGGQVRMPTNDMASEIAQCVKDAGAYYRMSFTPPLADGPDEYHGLQMKVDKRGLTARTSEMYYNQPPQNNPAAGEPKAPASKPYENLAQPR